MSKDYHVRLKDFTDMDHVQEQILECVAALYPEVFALLDAYRRRNEHFIEPAGRPINVSVLRPAGAMR